MLLVTIANLFQLLSWKLGQRNLLPIFLHIPPQPTNRDCRVVGAQRPRCPRVPQHEC